MKTRLLYHRFPRKPYSDRMWAKHFCGHKFHLVCWLGVHNCRKGWVVAGRQYWHCLRCNRRIERQPGK